MPFLFALSKSNSITRYIRNKIKTRWFFKCYHKRYSNLRMYYKNTHLNRILICIHVFLYYNGIGIIFFFSVDLCRTIQAITCISSRFQWKIVDLQQTRVVHLPRMAVAVTWVPLKIHLLSSLITQFR